MDVNEDVSIALKAGEWQNVLNALVAASWRVAATVEWTRVDGA